MQPILNLFLAIIRDISLIDIVDVVLVSYAIYRALLFIEGTRAYNLLKGLGIILVLLVITKDLDFNTVSWVLSNALPTGFLALVVIFQPELRRALEDIGRGKFLGEQIVSEESIPEMAEEVCKTIEACAKKRIGALIVFEQEIGLKDIVENGVLMRSRITSELLNTIFMPFTPLHDGAVVIKGQLIEAASCFLPTTSNHTDVAKELGARHRAAIGVTEVTDALVFVVSEETGQISKAKGGKLTRGLTMDRVRKLVAAAFTRVNRSRGIFAKK
ncbi:MAG: TIGR00159 family protein [Erysipelotrichia bacterium]|nr:diadenylate cyclase CdaA [Candidatus Riflebacteria bacterium]NCB37796.1 TIGR00159 family protein [Erysipelotrichia bacterium]